MKLMFCFVFCSLMAHAVTVTIKAKAYLIAAKDNPLANIKPLEKVGFVMKGGQVYKNEVEKQIGACSSAQSI